MSKAKAAGKRYATEQIEGSYFRGWVRDQLSEASRMDPSEVLPLETREDAEVIARNVLYQLEMDTRRDLGPAPTETGVPEFYEGFREKLDESVGWLADEILRMRGVREAKDRIEVDIVPGPGGSGYNIRRFDRGEFWNKDHWLGWPSHWWGEGRWRTEAEAESVAVANGFTVIDTRIGKHLSEATYVADFNTLDDLIRHAADELGATHVSGEGAHTKLYFPRGGQYPYEEATVRRKAGYWHADGPHARVGIESLPRGAKPIGREKGQRRAAEAYGRRRYGGRGRYEDDRAQRRQQDQEKWDRRSAAYREKTEPLTVGLIRFDDGSELVRQGVELPRGGDVVASLQDPRKNEEMIAIFRSYPGFGYSESSGYSTTWFVEPSVLPKGRRVSEEAHHSWEVIATDGGQTEILSRHRSRRAADRAARDTHMPGHRIEVVPSGTVPRTAEPFWKRWATKPSRRSEPEYPSENLIDEFAAKVAKITNEKKLFSTEQGFDSIKKKPAWFYAYVNAGGDQIALENHIIKQAKYLNRICQPISKRAPTKRALKRKRS